MNPGRGSSGGGDEWLAGVVIAAGFAALAVWAGAQLAALVASGSTLDASPADGLEAMIRLPSRATDPALAWDGPAAGQLPGPRLYWTCTVVTGLVGAGVVVAGFMVFGSTRVGTDRRHRLGVDTAARFARRGELASLVVSGPTRGRFILGRVNGKLVATEDHRGGRWRNREGGDRSAVIVVGPSRCGKTATVTAGALDWEGPAVLSSVKPDLFEATIKRRRRMGRVFVFDPFGELPEELGEGVQRVGWSPLQASGSLSGAQQAAATLVDASPKEGVHNASFWTTRGSQLLWPMLYAAAATGHTMGDVARWTSLQDGDGGEGEVFSVLSDLITNGGTAALEAQHALTSWVGFWKLDIKVRSDVFTTAQTLIPAWEDPYIAAASATSVRTDGGTITRPAITMSMLLEGNNTLYVIQPLESAARFAIVFGGLIGDLLRDQAYEISRRAGESIPPLLAVLDEAGNTPVRWLPHVASTCSGIGVQLVTVWQSLAQMQAIYQVQTDSLLTNHATKVFFSGISDESTLNYAMSLCGDEEVLSRSTTADTSGSGGRRSVATSAARTPLVSRDVLRRAKRGSALLVHGRLPPAHLVGRRPWRELRLWRLTKGWGPRPAPARLSDRMHRALQTEATMPEFVRAHMAEVASRQRIDLAPRPPVASAVQQWAPPIADDAAPIGTNSATTDDSDATGGPDLGRTGPTLSPEEARVRAIVDDLRRRRGSPDGLEIER